MTHKQKEFIGNLVKQQSAQMVQLTYRRIGDYRIAEELVQETFLTACFKIETICAHEKPVAWLYETLNNLTMREMSRAYHKRETPYEKMDLLGEEYDFLQIEDCFPKGLSLQEQELLKMRIEYKMSHEEIAAVKGITETACRKQLSRTVQKCKKLLKKEESAM